MKEDESAKCRVETLNETCPASNQYGARVFYRLPEALDYVEIRAKREPFRLMHYAQSSAIEGYVFAPFAISEQNPFWLIPNDETIRHEIGEPEWQRPRAERCEGDTEIKSYSRAFARCKEMLTDGRLEKIVLSRTATFRLCDPLTAKHRLALFLDACRSYPHSFVSLVELPSPHGAWLMATPEILIETHPDGFHTMALAGTSPVSDKTMGLLENWSPKNRKEQAYVADYIRKYLANFSSEVRESPVYVRKAASLFHLCTDFYLPPSGAIRLSTLAEALHPTPAVCGTPVEEARRVIAQVETHDRAYYSGFSGPVHQGEAHLFVNLRCAHLFSTHATLYAGGGLLKDSQLDAEWAETERKLTTMSDLFRA